MNMLGSRREPQPIILPISRREAASQITVVDRPGSAHSPARCDLCGTAYEVGARFCGECGTGRERPSYTRLVSCSR
ncbi:hypothetical protein [Reticulibacter mediterranei]|uniref:hypothetical protein n=1 Tax=Reticulibacter mediterranei TaxID=2778369 RepID=UPI001C688026|nr:hypothetical protein [Reticulibacter mediterranei]